jgi:hypothetical protein
MRPGIFYLPEYHDFKYTAVVPWPWVPISDQSDWIDSLFTLEDWLNRHIGPHYAEWAYSQQQDLEYWQACVAFKRERNKTLFLLTWAS